jgi:hypothetical protein
MRSKRAHARKVEPDTAPAHPYGVPDTRSPNCLAATTIADLPRGRLGIRYSSDTKGLGTRIGCYRMSKAYRHIATSTLSVLMAGALFQCGSSSGADTCSNINPDASFTQSPSVCYPDNDGINGGTYVVELVVTDTGFLASDVDGGATATKNIIGTQNDAQVILTLTNMGTTPHGFAVGCASVCPSYPNLPAGCNPYACFTGASIAPIMPNTSMTITFDTPTPDGLIYPFTSNNPADNAVLGLNQGQWSLM